MAAIINYGKFTEYAGLISRSGETPRFTTKVSTRVSTMEKVKRPRIAVIGAGIIGLPAAVMLTEIFCKPEVTLIAEEFSPDTTSDTAGSIIWPADHSEIGSHDSRRDEWTKVTFQYLYNLFSSPLAKTLDINLVPAYEVYEGEREDPWWKDYVLGFRHVGEEEMKVLHYPVDRKCWGYSTLMMIGASYLKWQMEQFKANGGVVVQRRLESLEEIDGAYDIIVNCTGLGSRQLVNDPEVYPVRGQLIVVRAPWIKSIFIYETKDNVITYVLPRTDCVLLGGTADVGNWSTQVDPLVSKGIMERCCMYFPALSTAKILEEVVGLRPSRHTVRLEVDDASLKKSTVVHNYGHGGQGVTFFIGCAIDTVKLVEDCLIQKGFTASSKL
ncbi:D-aspartate oxidase-like [Dysidea avara]|uniref:D-aspartate oxidase-like n=1 Tax=Dysidea avara TaxID=196820 RepID=UPI00331A4E2D